MRLYTPGNLQPVTMAELRNDLFTIDFWLNDGFWCENVSVCIVNGIVPLPCSYRIDNAATCLVQFLLQGRSFGNSIIQFRVLWCLIKYWK